jgi:hypothetical protein
MITAHAQTGNAGLGHVGEPGAAGVGDQAVERVVKLEQFGSELWFGGGEQQPDGELQKPGSRPISI